MTTKAHEITWHIAREWEAAYASAVLSGIVGDAAHQNRGGYHISIEDQSSTNYSVIRPDDKAPPGDWPRNLSAGIDMSMSTSDMILCSSRLWNIWYDQTDPRRQYLNGFNGWFGSGPAKRYDYVNQGVQDSTPDHKWHVHLEERRRWVISMVAAKAIISVLKGQTKQQYIDSLIQGVSSMFCNYGEEGENVVALQHQLLQLDPKCLPQFGPDGGYGDETAKALSILVTGGEAKIYQGKEFALMQTAIAVKFAAAPSPLPPNSFMATGQLNLPASSITVTGEFVVQT